MFEVGERVKVSHGEIAYEGVTVDRRENGDVLVRYEPENARPGKVYETWWPSSALKRK